MGKSKALVLLLGATVTEVAGLFLWVQAVDRGQVAIGIVFIALGLLAERGVVYAGMQSVYGSPLPHPKVALNLTRSAILETVAWLLWLFVADSVNALLALAILLVTIHVLHCHQLGYFRRGKFSAYLTDPVVILFSAIESVAGHFWLIQVRDDAGLFGLDPVVAGGLILFVGILVEHAIEGRYFGKEERPEHMLGG